MPIQGLKVTIRGIELAELCNARAAHHRDRAKVYADQARSLETAQVEAPVNYSGGNPRESLLVKMNEHKGEASEMEFIAKHIDLSEVYMLENADLVKLGITKSRY